MSKIISIVTLNVAGLENTYVANRMNATDTPIYPLYNDERELIACENDSVHSLYHGISKFPRDEQKKMYRMILTKYLKNKDEYKKNMEVIFMKRVNGEDPTEEEAAVEVDMMTLSHLTSRFTNRPDADAMPARALPVICFANLFNKSFQLLKEDRADAIMYYDYTSEEGFGFLDEPTAHQHFKQVRSILRKDPEMVKGNGMKISTLNNLYLVRAGSYEIKIPEWMPENIHAQARKHVHMLILETDPEEHTTYTEEYKALKFVMPDITTTAFPGKTFSYLMFRSRKARDNMLRWIVKDTNADVWVEKLDSM